MIIVKALLWPSTRNLSAAHNFSIRPFFHRAVHNSGYPKQYC